MTIEVGYVAESTDFKVRLGFIVLGGYDVYADFSTDVRQTIAVHCFADNSGGEVFIFDHSDFPEAADIGVIPPEACGPDTFEAIIQKGGKYERDITLENRAVGRLVLTHILND